MIKVLYHIDVCKCSSCGGNMVSPRKMCIRDSLYNEMKESGVIDKTALVYGQMNEPPGARMRVGPVSYTHLCRKEGNREGSCHHRNRADFDVDRVWSAACFHATEGTV